MPRHINSIWSRNFGWVSMGDFSKGGVHKTDEFRWGIFQRGEYTKPMAFDGWFFKGGSTQNRWGLMGDFSKGGSTQNRWALEFKKKNLGISSGFLTFFFVLFICVSQFNPHDRQLSATALALHAHRPKLQPRRPAHRVLPALRSPLQLHGDRHSCQRGLLRKEGRDGTFHAGGIDGLGAVHRGPAHERYRPPSRALFTTLVWSLWDILNVFSHELAIF